MIEDKILVLPEKIANQIAAGEVVNRPASVIKEMMENSIDASATEVIVNYKNYGQGLIQIVDNGEGMSPNDARVAFDRHATSKIRSADDIYNLSTFGFRGEALASIAAVAQVELKTRHREASFGTHTTINGGQFIDQTKIDCDFGTQFFVRNLFYNIPARRKFIEKDTRAASSIKSEFKRVALCNPQIGFELYADDAPIYKLQPTTLANRIVDIIGGSIKSNLLEVAVETVIVKVSGYIGTPKSAKKSTTDQYLFINGRYFKSKYLNRAVMKAYDKIIPQGNNPPYFLFLEVDPEKIDVNVHPQKTEVKFVDESAIWQIINAGVRETLAKTGAIPMMQFDNECDVEIPIMRSGESYDVPESASDITYNPFRVDSGGGGGISSGLYSPSGSSSNMIEQMWESDFGGGINLGSNLGGEIEYVDSESRSAVYDGYKLQTDLDSYYNSQLQGGDQESCGSSQLSHDVGDIFFIVDHYCWCRMGRNMVAVDLRRAKERTLYDHYIKTLNVGNAASQRILFPIELTLTYNELALLEENMQDFASLGFEISVIREECRIEITGIPADIKSERVEVLVRDILVVLTTPQSVEEQHREKLARTMARSGALSVGGSGSIVVEQAQDIINQLVANGNTGHTPGGKRIMWLVGKDEIKHNLER